MIRGAEVVARKLTFSNKIRELLDGAPPVPRWLFRYIIVTTVQEIPRSRYSHATTWQRLRARILVRHTRSVHSHTRAPTKLVSTTMDFRAFVAEAPHLTIPRQRTLVYGGKLLFSNAAAKFPRPYLRNDTMDFHF